MFLDALYNLIGPPPEAFDINFVIYLINLRFVFWILERIFIFIEDMIFPTFRKG